MWKWRKAKSEVVYKIKGKVYFEMVLKMKFFKWCEKCWGTSRAVACFLILYATRFCMLLDKTKSQYCLCHWNIYFMSQYRYYDLRKVYTSKTILWYKNKEICTKLLTIVTYYIAIYLKSKLYWNINFFCLCRYCDIKYQYFYNRLFLEIVDGWFSLFGWGRIHLQS